MACRDGTAGFISQNTTIHMISNLDEIPLIWDDDAADISGIMPSMPSSPAPGRRSIYFGETIRNMTYVTPMVENIQTDLSVDDIAQRYFPDATDYLQGDPIVVCDVDSVVTDENLIRRRNANFEYADGRFAFTVYIFYSRDAVKLKESYNCLKPAGRQVVFFIEDNTGDVSEQYGAVKFSEEVKNYLGNKTDAHLNNNANVYKYLKGIIPGLTDSQVREIMHEGKLEYKNANTLATIMLGLAQMYKIQMNMLMPGFGFLTDAMLKMNGHNAASHVFGKAAEFINKAKIDDDGWNPDTTKIKGDGSQDTSYNPKTDFSPFFFPGVEEFIEGSMANGVTGTAQIMGSRLADMDAGVRKFLGISESSKNSTGLEAIKYFIYTKYESLSGTVSNMLAQLEKTNLDVLAINGLRIYNAYLCGIWNGFVEAVSGLVLMVKYIFDAIGLISGFLDDIYNQLPLALEHVDNIAQAIRNISFGKIISHISSKVTDFAEGGTALMLVKTAYFCGAAVGFIISLAVEIAAGILVSGGSLSVAAIAEKLVSLFTSIVRAGTKMVRGVVTVTKATIKTLYKMFEELTAFLRQGTDNIIKYIDELFEGVKKVDNLVTVTAQELETFKKTNRLRKDIDVSSVIKLIQGRKDLAESILLSTKEVRQGKSLKQLMRIFSIIDPPALHSLSNYQTRIWYSWKKSRIDTLIKNARTLEEKARKAFDLRNEYRSAARQYMSDRKLAEYLEQVEKNQTWIEFLKYLKEEKNLIGDDAYEYILGSALKGRERVDKLYQIQY